MFPFFGLRNMQRSQANTSKALEKMNKGELKVEDVLDDEELINELRSYTYSQLMNFLTQENLTKIVDYIIKQPIEDNQKYGHKFPFNASEILCSENVFVIDKFFEDINKTIEEEQNFYENKNSESNQEKTEELAEGIKDLTIHEVNQKKSKDQPIKKIVYPVIDHLFTFVKSDQPLNYVLCGYFYKVLNHLSNFRNTLLINYIFLHRKDVIDDMIKHLNRKSICDTLAKLTVSYSADIQDQDVKLELLLKIFHNFDTDDEEKSENVCEMIYDMLQNRRVYYLFAKNKQILETIYKITEKNLHSKTCVIRLLKILTKFIEQVIRDTTPPSNQGAPDKNDFDKENEIDYQDDEGESGTINLYKTTPDMKVSGELELKNYLDIFDIIFQYLEMITNDFTCHSENTSPLLTTYEKEIKPLGLIKLSEFEYLRSLFELLVNILNNNNYHNIEIISKKIESLTKKIIEISLFDSIINYFFEYENNNFYQIIFEKLITLVTNKNIPENLVTHMFLDCKLIEKIIENTFSNGVIFTSGNSIFPGYLATMCNVGKIINSSDNPHLKKILSTNDEWNYLCSICILQVNNQFEKGLLYSPSKSDSPFQRYNSGVSNSNDNKEPSNAGITNSLKTFIELECWVKFQNFKDKRRKSLEISVPFDVNNYLKDEQDAIKLEEKASAISIPILDDEMINSITPENELEAVPEDVNSYSDVNYFWKTYKVDIDLSDL